jgi:hypothetical protein
MILPAVCDSCSSMFPSGISVEGNAYNVTIVNSCSGPCPNCGGTGHIPDGTFNFIDNVIQLLSGPERTVSELFRLAEILGKARKEGASVSKIDEEVREKLPQFSRFIGLLPKSRSELYAFLSLILTVITLVTGGTDHRPPSNVNVNQVINHVYLQRGLERYPVQSSPKLQREESSPAPRKKKIGRNDPCPCGSGKKHKHCCRNKQ